MELNHKSNTPPLQHHKCTGFNCDYAITGTGDGICFSGSGTCLACNLLEAEPSAVHDKALMEATQKIKQILAAIPADADGRQLSFLVTNMGLLLGWVNHDAPVPENAVTAKDDDATIAKALKLKN